MKRALGHWVKPIVVAAALVCAWQGCAQLAGLEEPEDPTAATSGGGSGHGGRGGAGGGGAGGAGGGCELGPGEDVLASGQVRPAAIVVNAGSIFWTAEGNATDDRGIWKLEAGSTTPASLATTSPRIPTALAADDDNVYWADADDMGPSCSMSCDGGGAGGAGGAGGVPDVCDRIMKTPHSASPGDEAVLDFFCGEARGIALDARNVYWARPRINDGFLQSKPKTASPSDSTPTIVNMNSGIKPSDLDTDDADPFVYFTDEQGLRIIRREKTPSGINDASIDTIGIPTRIGLDAQNVYWMTDMGVWAYARDLSMNMGGELSDIPSTPVALAVDLLGESVYIATSSHQIMKVPKMNGSRATTIATTSTTIGDIAVDGTYVYWTEPDMGQIKRACK